MTSHSDPDVIVFDILGTMVDEPSGIRRGLRTLLPDIDEARTRDLVEVWQRHVDEQQQEILAGRRPYVGSTVIDFEAAKRAAADAEISDADAVRSLAASAHEDCVCRTSGRRPAEHGGLVRHVRRQSR